MQTMFTPNNYYALTGLSCCTPYQYSVSASTAVGQGIPSVSYAFRTPANNLRKFLILQSVKKIQRVSHNSVVVYMCVHWSISDFICLLWRFISPVEYVTVGVNVDSRTSLTVNWNIPANVTSQGLDTVAVSATPICVTGVVLEGQQFTTSDENAHSNTFSSLSESTCCLL